MTVDVFEQLRELITGFIAGGGIGLLGDLLQVPRSLTGKSLRLFWDLVLLILSGIWIFVLGQRSGAGMRLFFLSSAGAGICFYLASLHPMVYSDLITASHFVHNFIQKYAKTAVSSGKKFKNDRNGT